MTAWKNGACLIYLCLSLRLFACAFWRGSAQTVRLPNHFQAAWITRLTPVAWSRHCSHCPGVDTSCLCCVLLVIDSLRSMSKHVTAMILLLCMCGFFASPFTNFSCNLKHVFCSLCLDLQLVANGDATQCCCENRQVVTGKCGAAHNICVHFYDSAPSGRFGTMAYLSQAVLSRCRQAPRLSGELNADDRPPECLAQWGCSFLSFLGKQFSY